eukprot:TRINITY_DN10345_c0_g1_i1.p1 TRINITY_DN10345_c0_g1~~TRINITY_DN10345_c0_g1_i1.p1  ORF type:complete len:326 (+),score=122.09 TRINITY_DN10345_c0_g1_i1:54-980(+)
MDETQKEKEWLPPPPLSVRSGPIPLTCPPPAPYYPKPSPSRAGARPFSHHMRRSSPSLVPSTPQNKPSKKKRKKESPEQTQTNDVKAPTSLRTPERALEKMVTGTMEKKKKKKKNKRHNQRSSSSSLGESDDRQKLGLAKGVGKTKDPHLLFLENIRSLRLKVPDRIMSDQEEDIKKYLEERRKNFPTQARIKESAKMALTEQGVESEEGEVVGKREREENAVLRSRGFDGKEKVKRTERKVQGRQRKERKRMDARTGREGKGEEGETEKRKDAPSLWERLVTDQMEEEEQMIIEIFKYLHDHVMSLH